MPHFEFNYLNASIRQLQYLAKRAFSFESNFAVFRLFGALGSKCARCVGPKVFKSHIVLDWMTHRWTSTRSSRRSSEVPQLTLFLLSLAWIWILIEPLLEEHFVPWFLKLLLFPRSLRRNQVIFLRIGTRVSWELIKWNYCESGWPTAISNRSSSCVENFFLDCLAHFTQITGMKTDF